MNVTKVLAVAIAAGLCAGCATFGGGDDDAALIDAMLHGFEAAFVANDLDQIMSYYSDDFDSPDQGDKAAIREFLGGAIDQGFLEDAEVDRSEAEVNIAGATATVYPVEISAAFGSATLNLGLAKEDAGWKIKSQVIEGI